jgi:hypothetical protein
MSGPLKWYDHNADNPPWIKALAEVRIQATREGWCHAHVQAIILRSTSTPKRRWVTGVIFSTSRMGLGAAGAITCRDWQGLLNCRLLADQSTSQVEVG